MTSQREKRRPKKKRCRENRKKKLFPFPFPPRTPKKPTHLSPLRRSL